MHAALALRRRGAELEAEPAVVELRAEILHRARADVLQAVLDALHQVGDEAVHRALVLDGARDSLCHLDGAGRTEVSVVGALLHGVDGAHASVALQADAGVGVKVLTWRLLCACQQAAAHRCPRPQAQRLDDVPWAGNATVRQDRNAVRPRELGDAVHGRGLGPATSADQIEPMPMPTRSASTPESIKFLACLFVTTLPPTTCMSGNSFLIHLTISCW
mmetsp:Transcript_62664/g.204517  ORF Transcript_62664/g.204517 Transcript_62664/m.204517 type:complete len:218 (-) Transcript_62664:59-712(-)